MHSLNAKSRYPSVQRSLTLAAILLAAVACGDNTPPGAAPNLVSTNPSDAAANVALNTNPTATFDTPVPNLTATDFTLKQGTTAVAGAVTVSGDGLTATFTPASALAAGTAYTGTIHAGAKSFYGGTFAADQSWTFTTVAPGGTVAPTLVSTYPANNGTGIPLNAKVSATFDRAMTPLTSANFTLVQGTTAVTGTVATSSDGTSAVFTPAANLSASLVYTATVAAGVTSTAGGALAAAQSWTFTTGTTADTTAPAISATSPLNNATGVAINSPIGATFTKAMDPQTLNSTTFTLKQGTTAVPGTVSYGPGTLVRFTSTSALTSGVVYTASISTGAKDVSGNALASAVTWTFTTGTTAAKGPAPVLLGAAGNYVVLAQTAISTVPTSAITGDLGLSPAAESFITGFNLTDATGYATSTQVAAPGKVYAADMPPPTNTNLTTAVNNMQTAYTDAASRPTPNFLELGTGNIGGKTLVPGLYKWTSTVTIPTGVTLNGGANDVWIFQTSGDLSMAASQQMTLAGGALAKNIFWQVAGKVTIGAGAHFEGILLCKTQVTLETGASMNGRILAQTQVALQKATLVQPAP